MYGEEFSPAALNKGCYQRSGMKEIANLGLLLNSIDSIWSAHRVRLVDSQFVKDSCPVDSREGSDTAG